MDNLKCLSLLRLNAWYSICTFFVTLLFMTGCSTEHNFVITADDPSAVLTLVPLETIDAPGNRLPNPANLTEAVANGKAVRVGGEGKISRYFVFPFGQSSNTDLKVKHLSSVPSCLEDKSRNLSTRIVMKAYQALFGEEYRKAIELAAEAAKLDPVLAAPHIVSGLAYFKTGKKENARTSLLRAKELDPTDEEIQQLLGTIR